jgi:hypothetical protein
MGMHSASRREVRFRPMTSDPHFVLHRPGDAGREPGWQARLAHRPNLIMRLTIERGWRPATMRARSRGLPAIAVPGVDSWRPEWARWFVGRTVTIVADADAAGRGLAARVADDLAGVARPSIVDLARDARTAMTSPTG